MNEVKPDVDPAVLRPGECVLWVGRSDVSTLTHLLGIAAALAIPAGIGASLVPPKMPYELARVDVITRNLAVTIGIGTAVALAALAARREVRRRALRYVVTNQRALVATGPRVTDEAPLDDVSKLLFGFAAFDQTHATAVHLVRTGPEPLRFESLADPEGARRAIEEALATARRDAAANKEKAGDAPPTGT